MSDYIPILARAQVGRGLLSIAIGLGVCLGALRIGIAVGTMWTHSIKAAASRIKAQRTSDDPPRDPHRIQQLWHT